MDVMLDLETLSTRPNAVILILAAIKFKRSENYNEQIIDKNLEKLDTFYRRIKISSCTEVGLIQSQETIDWWAKQNDDVKNEAINNKDRVLLQDALKDFSVWFKEGTNGCIWGNGSDFDITILGEAYNRCNIEIPWKFWLVRDLRTILDIGKIRINSIQQTKLHHALYDCYRQIVAITKALRNLNQ